MHMRDSIRSLSLATVGVLAAATGASATTLATFADPALGPATPMFAFNAGTGVLTGGWMGRPNLLLQTPGLPSIPDFPNAQFQMTPISATGSFGNSYIMGGGAINFFDATSAPLLTISFSNAVLTSSLGLGSSDFYGFNVAVSGPILAGLGPAGLGNPAFSFSFANPVATAPPGSYTVTSSFTSSCDFLIPTPGASALLCCTGLALARRPRRSAREIAAI